jgi:hypothetical protein
VLALLALAARPSYPYGWTLAVALTQDWAPAQDTLTLAALVAWRAPAVRVPAPGAASMWLMAFVAYALLTPERALHWDGHPGNEPKYLRTGVALGWRLSLNVEPWTSLGEGQGPLESVAPEGAAPALSRAVFALGSESARMLAAALPGGASLGRDAIRAERVDRQTVLGKDGGVFHVLAPGPSFLLAPTLRADRALDRLRGTPGRVAVSVLAWNALAAATVAVLFLLLRDATGRPGLAAVVAGGLALLPPFLFYSFQFYPELPGALVMAEALRRLALRERLARVDASVAGLLLATLPWLHQKFLPAWIALLAVGVVRQVWELAPRGELARLLAPQVASGYLFLLWNFAITGSARPDAAFLAWGPAGVAPGRVHEGALGLLLDARYGILPYVPVYVLAAGGLVVAGPRAFRLLTWGAPPVLAYYLTVAAADNWSGAVCNLGRYAMPALPWLAAFLAVALEAAGRRRGALALALALCGLTALLATALWRDPHAANDCALLLAEAAFADGNVYVPNLFFRSPGFLAPGHAARVLAWVVLAGAIGFWLRRASRGRAGASPDRLVAGATLAVLAFGFVLERWPTARHAARFPRAVALGRAATVFLSDGRVEGDLVRAPAGALALLVRSAEAGVALELTASGDGVLRLAGRPPLPLRPRGVALELPLEVVARLTGRRGVRETLAGARLGIESPGEVALRFVGIARARVPPTGGLP